MTAKHSNGRTKGYAPIRWVGDVVGRVAIPIRAKFLISFLAVVALMIGLALTGLTELREANTRASQLVDDQIRIGTLQTLAVSIQTTKLKGALLFPEPNDSAESENLLKDFEDEVYLFRAAGSGQIGIERATFFLTPEFEDEFQEAMRDADRIAGQIRKKYADGDALAAHTQYVSEFVPAMDSLTSMVFSMYFDLRQGMRGRADENAAEFGRAQRLVISASWLAVALALAFGIAISTSIVQPLDRIRFALGQLAGGRFDARVVVPNNDELGELAGHVNQTSEKLGALYDQVETQNEKLSDWNAALEEKVDTQVTEIERANRLRRFLPAQVVDLLTGSDSAEEALATRRGEITVLFADLRGFTTFANASAPDQVVGALNAFHETCGPLVEAEGGTLERFLGDGLMVLFGAPVPVEDAAERAVRLALTMRDAVRVAMEPFQSDHAPLGFGIGIGTGLATLGQIGFEGRRDYSAIGPAPNLAARLCELAKDGQILLSHATVWQLDRATTPAGTVNLKGIGEKIAIFEV